MEVFFFFYNNFITVCYIICFIGFMILRYKRHSDTYTYIALVFLFFIFDNLIPYMNEFLQGVDVQYIVFNQGMISGRPYLTNLIGFLIVFFYRLSLMSFQGKVMTAWEKAFWTALLAVYLVLSSFYSSYYARLTMTIIRRIISIAVFLDAYINRGKTPENADLSQRQIHGFLSIALSLQIAASVEAVLPYFGVRLLFEDRVIFIEIIGLFFSTLGCVYVFKQFIKLTVSKGNAPSPDVTSTRDVEEQFCNRYLLTKREREVMSLIIDGMSNEEIAQSLIVTLGTVKTHVHNIYQKLGVSNRLQLVRMFNEFKQEQ